MTVQGKAPPSCLSASKTDQARMVGWTRPAIFLVINTHFPPVRFMFRLQGESACDWLLGVVGKGQSDLAISSFMISLVPP